MPKKSKSKKKKAAAKPQAAARKSKGVTAKPEASSYDATFEVMCRLAHLARTGHDVNALLIQQFEENMVGLRDMPEFQVAMGIIPRPAGTTASWFLEGEK